MLVSELYTNLIKKEECLYGVKVKTEDNDKYIIICNNMSELKPMVKSIKTNKSLFMLFDDVDFIPLLINLGDNGEVDNNNNIIIPKQIIYLNGYDFRAWYGLKKEAKQGDGVRVCIINDIYYNVNDD